MVTLEICLQSVHTQIFRWIS